MKKIYKKRLIYRLFLSTEPKHVNIWFKKSNALGKSILLEFRSKDEQFYIFVDRKYEYELLYNPYKAIQFLSERTSFKINNAISKDGLFYYNGHKIKVKTPINNEGEVISNE